MKTALRHILSAACWLTNPRPAYPLRFSVWLWTRVNSPLCTAYNRLFGRWGTLNR